MNIIREQNPECLEEKNQEVLLKIDLLDKKTYKKVEEIIN